MSVFLGDAGRIMLRRSGTAGDWLASALGPDDVNPSRRRFSFDFEAGALITGDEIEIRTEDGSDLELVAGHAFPDGRWYAHLDDAGGVRLYETFGDAINGEYEPALDLVVPSRSISIAVRTRNDRWRCLGQIRSWELTTNRATVDTTSLGEEFVRLYTRGLVSGQGSLTCLWDYQQRLCDPMQPEEHIEEPNYLCQLLLRLKQGAGFSGQFYVHYGSPAIWYEATCTITNVGLSFEPGAPIQSRVEFVTTGPVSLHTGQLDTFILQESADRLLLEGGQDGAIMQEEPL